jgi:Tfp pilus assembly protein PilF
VFAIQSAVAESVADALEVTLAPGEKHQLQKQGTQNLEAYHLYLQGLQLYHRASEDGLKNSISYFERALQLDPTYAQACVGLARAYQVLGFISLHGRPRDAFEQSRTAAEKALELDDTIVDAHLTAAVAWQVLDYDQARAKLAYERAVELAPNSALAHDLYGVVYLAPMGRHEEAIAENARAVELEPVSVLYISDLGWVYYAARQYDRAIVNLQKRSSWNRVTPTGTAA